MSLADLFCPAPARDGGLRYARLHVSGTYLLAGNTKGAALQAAATTVGLIPGMAAIRAADQLKTLNAAGGPVYQAMRTGGGLIDDAVAKVPTAPLIPTTKAVPVATKFPWHAAAARIELGQKGLDSGLTNAATAYHCAVTRLSACGK
ncbi:MAG TPA: hypothetical protein VFC19_17385 [Candidatus Limnocylindrales bacterium]|nr:hypothetical protein [Candidatus Limnocylindrales bacterium]